MTKAAAKTKSVRRLSVLGSTGSIGCNTIDLIVRNMDRFDVEVLTGGKNVKLLAEQAILTGAKLAVIAEPGLYGELKDALAGTNIAAAAGREELIAAAGRPVDLVMAAIVGAAGLAPTLAAVRESGALALANKECLVSAGALFMAEVEKYGTDLLPVDSEHNAIFQVLVPEHSDQIERITLTASGGPFRRWSRSRMAEATTKQALNHPNWSMGRKLTIDSATMANKGLELIEAYHLFPVSPDQLDVLVHPQSIVHSLVEYTDGSVLAQMSAPDMRTPIAYALSWPCRMATPSPRLDLRTVGKLTFEAVDNERFPAVELAKDCLVRGSGAPTVFNAANEVAVSEFLAGNIGFLEIVELIRDVLDHADAKSALKAPGSLDDVIGLDGFARAVCVELAARSRTRN